MAAIAMQPSPRLNFPDDPAYTLDKVMHLANRLVDANARALSKDVRKIVEENVSRWHTRRVKEPASKLLHITLDPYEEVEISLKAVEGTVTQDPNAMEVDGQQGGGEGLRVSIGITVVPKVALQFIVQAPMGPRLGLGPRAGTPTFGVQQRGVRSGTPPLPMGSMGRQGSG